MALSIHFDHDEYSRSVYPGAKMPVQQNLVFENVTIENKIGCLVRSITPVDTVKIVNSTIYGKCMQLECLESEKGAYSDTQILLMGNTICIPDNEILIECQDGRSCKFTSVGNLTEDSFQPKLQGEVR